MTPQTTSPSWSPPNTCTPPVGIARTLGEDRRAMPKAERLPVVAHLLAEGHSKRAIGDAVGVSHTQIYRDAAEIGTDVPIPSRVSRQGGGTYPAQRAPKATVDTGPKYVTLEGYNARHDPDYPDRLLNDLVDHRGQWRALHKLFGGDFETVREAVAMGRRVGLQIEGDHDRGYRYVGFRRIRKVRVAKAEAWPNPPARRGAREVVAL